MKKTSPFLFGLLAVLILLVVVVNRCWSVRDTNETRREARRATVKELRETAPENVLAFMERLTAEKKLHVWFVPNAEGQTSPWKFWTLRIGMLTRVPYDTIAQLTENQFIRFAGDGQSKAADTARLKELLAFSEKLIPLCSEQGANSLRERRLDGYFLSGDYDAAVKLLESGAITTRTPLWCKGTAAKLRAHKAMDAGDKKEAVKQLLVFGEFMLSDEQKNFEDCDPTTGVLYSREWVVARNFMRCAKMTDELGDKAKAAEYKTKAAGYFKTALEKAKDEPKSLELIKEEMKTAGL